MTGTASGSLLAGRYRLLDQVAVGSMGEVWRAHDDRLDRDVAVKVLRPELAEDDAFRARFRSEARHAASVRHPHVAAVHDYGEDVDVRTGGTATAYLVMDLLDGRPLSAVLAESGPLPPRRVAALLVQVADALAVAHRMGLVHRDIKPGNLVVSRDPDDEVTVTDFGIARAADAVPLTRTGLVMGTAEYLSPEQARGARATTASDVYSLGVVAYELLTGSPPFTGSSPADVARAHVQDAVPPLPDGVPVELGDTVLRCLRKSPATRPDVQTLARRLDAIASGRAIEPDAPWAAAADPPAEASTPSPAEPSTETPARPAGSLPRLRPTAEIPTSATARTRPGTSAHTDAARRLPVRAPLMALLALVALLLLASVLQATGVLGGSESPQGTGPDADQQTTAGVTRSSTHPTDKDGR